MIYCRDCMHGQQEFCCGGCVKPTAMPLGSCLHYEKNEVK